MQAWRAGHVLIANALGTGVLESPALLAFLPGICERLLGERLELPSVATWWCGEAAARADVHVAARRHDHQAGLARSHDGARLSRRTSMKPERDAWMARIDETPEQLRARGVSAAVARAGLARGQLESRAVMLRVFLVADGHGDYQVMPGGLTRIAGSDRHIVSSQRGGSSKDTWVLSDAPVERVRRC